MSLNGLPADLSVFDFVPNLFVGIEFGGMGGEKEKEQAELGAMGADELAHHRRAVERGAIRHEDQGARAIPKQALEEGDELQAIHAFFHRGGLAFPPRARQVRPARVRTPTPASSSKAISAPVRSAKR